MDTFNIKLLRKQHINFRKHHSNPLSMEEYPFHESITEIMPVFIPVLFIISISNIKDNTSKYILTILFFSIIIASSAQISHRMAHRRNHEYDKNGKKKYNIPYFIKFLQDKHIILNNNEHKKHHKTEIMNYCISNSNTSKLFDSIINLFNLPTSTYINSNSKQTFVSKDDRKKIITQLNNMDHPDN
jgi:Na+/melibiose symporter-like transporter